MVALLDSLPSFSPVVSRLLQLISREESSMSEVGELLERDVALTADVLRLANSPLYGQRHEIDNPRRAMVLLGAKAVRGLVLTVVLRNFSRAASCTPAFQQCWRHNLACALVMSDFAPPAGLSRETGYCLGLLHDAGHLALLAAHPVSYARLLEGGASSAAEMIEKERDLFEIDHCQAGALLAQAWGLPDAFAASMLHHHDVDWNLADGKDASLIAHLACELANMAGFPGWGAPKEWDTTHIQATLPEIAESLRDAGELISRIAAGINALECSLCL